MVAQAEKFLHNMGIKQLRVRHHNNIARIEVCPEDIHHLVSPDIRKKILRTFKKIGYHYITLDLQGYRTGSMNKLLTGDDEG